MELSEILSRCDHTLLRTDAGSAEIRQLCDEAVKYGCASVCIPPCHVPGAKKYLAGRVPVCTVIGFPNGYMTTAAKAFEAADAVAKGADEVDMVINLAMVKDGDWDAVAEDIAAVRRATEGHILKVIIECCLLTDEDVYKRQLQRHVPAAHRVHARVAYREAVASELRVDEVHQILRQFQRPRADLGHRQTLVGVQRAVHRRHAQHRRGAGLPEMCIRDSSTINQSRISATCP